MPDIGNEPTMAAAGFKSVVDFRAPRSWLAAAGFYFFHLIVMLCLCGLAGMIMTMMGATDQAEAYQIGLKAGQCTAYIYSVALYVLIISAKKLWNNPWYIAALVATLLLSVVGGVIGLIPSAIVLGLKSEQKAAN